MHAVLSLSFVHRAGVVGSYDQERLALQHYCKSIGELQPHFASKDKTSIRITLITCIVFISLEFLRGHFQTAETHLASGLKVLEALARSKSPDDAPPLRSAYDPVDDWINQAFSRFCFQLALFKSKSPKMILIPRSLDQEASPVLFDSTNEAWLHLESLTNSILQLTEDARSICDPYFLTSAYPETVAKRQKDIQDGLTQWLETFQKSEHHFQVTEQLPIVCRLLHSYYSMAKIMVATCLWLDETAYDEHTEQFSILIEHSTAMWRFRESNPMTRPPRNQGMSMSHSMVDIGWIPPLFFTALKCRIHSIRIQAVNLMEYASHREGIWDSRIAARVARKIVELEEDTSKNGFVAEGDGLADEPRQLLLDFSLPHVSRISEIEVVLPDDGSDAVGLCYKREEANADWEHVQIVL
jgi:hypothetical protein